MDGRISVIRPGRGGVQSRMLGVIFELVGRPDPAWGMLGTLF